MADKKLWAFSMFVVVLALAAGCTPRVEVAVPDKPIEININAKIDHEVRVKVERDVESLLDKEKELF
jgi:type IV pilus biogenesis protein CpaD/CtpE